MRRTILLACLLALAATTAAFAETHIYSSAGHGTFPVEPAKLKYKPAEIGGSQSYVLKELDWQGWGQSKATGEGQLTSCVGGKACFDVDAEAKASKLEKSGADGYYTKLKLTFGQNRVSFRLPTPNG